MCLAATLTRALFLVIVLAAAALPVEAQSVVNITFGQSVVLSGPNAFFGIRMAAGVRAAFKEFNDDGGARGRFASLVTYDDGYNPAPAVANTQRLLSVDKVFALIGYFGTANSNAVLPIATAVGCPFIGPYTGTSALRAPYNPNAVNIRASYNDETAAMTQVLVGKYSVRRIACFYQDDPFGFSGFGGITRALSVISLPLVSTGVYARNSVNVTEGLDAIAAPGNIQAVVLIATVSAAAQFIREAKQRSGIAANCRFVTLSAGADGLVEALDPSEYANVYVTQVVPPPTDVTSQVVRKYQSAMRALEGRQDIGTDFVSLEGYISGRFVTSVLARMPDVTRASFTATVQDESLFVVDDIVLGLFSGACAANSAAAVTGCECNQGSRRVWTLGLSPQGQWVPVGSDFQWSLATCQSPASIIVAPMSFVVSYPSNDVVGSLMADGIAAAFAASVTRSIASGRTLTVQRRPYVATGSNVSVELNNLLNDVYVSGVIGSALAARAAVAVDLPVFGRIDVSMSDAIRDALATVTRGGDEKTTGGGSLSALQTVLLVTPPLEDEILALVQAAASRWGADAVRTQLTVAAAPVDLAAATALASAAAAATVLGGTVTSTAVLPLTLARRPGVSVLLLLSDDPADVLAAAQMVRAGQLSGLLLPFRTASLLPWNANTSTITTPNAVLVSRPYHDLLASSASVNATFAETNFVSDTAGMATNMTRNPSFQAGYLVGRYIAALVSRSGGALQTAEAFLKNVFSGPVSIDEYTVGPFAVGGCTRGLRRVPVQALSGSVVWIMTKLNCHADYTAITTADNTLAGWIVALIVIGSIIAVAVIAAVVALRGRAAYRLSFRPLDASHPFVVMFVGVKNDAELRDLGDDNYHSALQTVRTAVRDATRDNRCYEARRVDEGTVMIVAKSVEAALGCAAQLTVTMETTEWSKIVTRTAVEPATQHETSGANSGSKHDGRSSHSSDGRGRVQRSRRAVPMNRSGASVTPRSATVSDGGRTIPFINVGVHYGFGNIDYDADAGTVSYHGAVVTQAAVTADAASARQVLVSANVVAALEEADCDIPGKLLSSSHGHHALHHRSGDTSRRTSEIEVVSTAAEVFMYIPPGLPSAYEQAMCSEKKKEAFAESAAGTGGITAALTSADAGLAKRCGAVVSLYVPQLLERAVDPHGAHELALDLDELRAVVAMFKGTVVSVVGRHVALGVNLSGPSVTLPQVRATSIALKCVEIFGEGASAGIASGIAIGAAGVCVGRAVDAADTARLAVVAAGLQCGAAVTSAHELDTQFRVVTIDAVEIPDTDVITRVLAVLESIEADQLEWLYAMDLSKEIAVNEQLWAELASRPDGIATELAAFATVTGTGDATPRRPVITMRDEEKPLIALLKERAMEASRAALDELRRECAAREGAEAAVRRYARHRFDAVDGRGHWHTSHPPQQHNQHLLTPPSADIAIPRRRRRISALA